MVNHFIAMQFWSFAFFVKGSDIIILHFFKPVKFSVGIKDKQEKQQFQDQNKNRIKHGLLSSDRTKTKASHKDPGKVIQNVQGRRRFDPSGDHTDQSVQKSWQSDYDPADNVIRMYWKKQDLRDHADNRYPELASGCLHGIASVQHFFRYSL